MIFLDDCSLQRTIKIKKAVYMTTHTKRSVLGRKKYLALALPLLMAAQAQSVEFKMGGVTTTLDSQLSIGSSFRAEDPDAVLTPEGKDGTGDDGNRNYDKGDAFSQIFKGSHDLHIKYENFGVFLRGKYWYDSAIENNKINRGHGPTVTTRTDPSTATVAQSSITTFTDDNKLDDSNFDDLSKGSGVTLLDAFVYGAFEVGEMPLDVRLGRQVLSWGESLLIGGGISNTNPYDLSAFRRPGAEIKEGLLPVGMATANLGITDNLSAEVFYQYEWQNTVADACGTFFSTSDLASEGCNYMTISDGALTLSKNQSLAEKPSDDGQFGIAFRYFSEDIETEFGLYAMNVHGRLPIFNVQADVTPDVVSKAGLYDAIAGAGAASVAPGGFENFADAYVGGAVTAALQDGFDNGFLATPLSATATIGSTYDDTYLGGDGTLQTAADKGTAIAGGALGGDLMAAYLAAQPLTVNDTARDQMIYDAVLVGRTLGSSYAMSYPEDQKLVGVSFSTNVAGMSWAGEISHKLDMPVQINGTLLAAAVLDRGYAGADANAAKAAAFEAVYGSVNTEDASTIAGELVKGYREFDVTQIQSTLIHTVNNIAGASQIAFLGEVGVQVVHDFDDVLLYGSGDSSNEAQYDGNDKGYMTETSWGYKAVIAMTYNDVFAGVDLKPVLSWSHDVEGVSAGPGGPFFEGSQKLGLSVKAEYQNRYSASLGYTQYMDEDKVSDNFDRDFISASVDVQF
jgi:hypothetical protein